MSCTEALKNKTRYCDTCDTELTWEGHWALTTPEPKAWHRFCSRECVASFVNKEGEE